MGRVPIGAPSRHTDAMKRDRQDLAPGGTLLHVVVDRSRPSAETEAWVAERLLPGEQALWDQMSNQDRRHSALVGQRFAEHGSVPHRGSWSPERSSTTSARSSAVSARSRGSRPRSIGPRGKRFTAYHDHEEIGATMAAKAGSAPGDGGIDRRPGPAFETLKACDHA